jgi:hypothetical protein
VRRVVSAPYRYDVFGESTEWRQQRLFEAPFQIGPTVEARFPGDDELGIGQGG